jgi:hypothetical protein
MAAANLCITQPTITGRVGTHGPRVTLTLFDEIDGRALAQFDVQPEKAAILQAAEVLCVEAVALQTIADLIGDNEVLGPHGLERLRIARERISDTLEVLAA